MRLSGSWLPQQCHAAILLLSYRVEICYIVNGCGSSFKFYGAGGFILCNQLDVSGINSEFLPASLVATSFS